MAERTEGRSRLQGKGGGDFPVSWHGNEKSRGANGTYVGRWRNIEPAKEFEGLEIVFQGWYDIRTEGGGERGEGGEGLSEVRQIRVSGGGSGGGPARGADLLVMFVYKPEERMVRGSRGGGVGGKGPELGGASWLVESGGRGEKRSEQVVGVKREIEKLKSSEG